MPTSRATYRYRYADDKAMDTHAGNPAHAIIARLIQGDPDLPRPAH